MLNCFTLVRPWQSWHSEWCEPRSVVPTSVSPLCERLITNANEGLILSLGVLTGRPTLRGRSNHRPIGTGSGLPFFEPRLPENRPNAQQRDKYISVKDPILTPFSRTEKRLAWKLGGILFRSAFCCHMSRPLPCRDK